MKTKVTLIGLMIIGLVGIAGAGGAIAAEQKGENAQIPAAAAELLIDGQPVQIRGVVEKTESGLFLLDGNGAFLLKGDNGLDKLVGQPVEIQGVFKKGEKNSMILVNQARVVH